MRSNEFYMERMGPPGDQQPYVQIIGEPDALASLFSKVVKVNSAIKKIKHTGNFSAGNTKYTYATESDVIEPVAKAFNESGIAFIPSTAEIFWSDLPGKYGTNRVCTVHAQIILGDSETGAYIVAHAYATAANADKAASAGFTTAIKYFAAKLALVAFGDDADEYTVDGQKATATPRRGVKRAVSEDTLNVLSEKVKAANATQIVKDYLKDNKWKWSDLTDSQVAAITELVEQNE